MYCAVSNTPNSPKRLPLGANPTVHKHTQQNKSSYMILMIKYIQHQKTCMFKTSPMLTFLRPKLVHIYLKPVNYLNRNIITFIFIWGCRLLRMPVNEHPVRHIETFGRNNMMMNILP